MAEIIQGIYRTRIRKEEPGSNSVSVYFTSDWSVDFIEDCMHYMHAKTEDGKILTLLTDAERLRRPTLVEA